MKDIGLILEGGAFRGIFTSGVIDYLIEKEVEFPYVIGVSAGACNMLGFLAKQKKYGIHSIIQENPSDRFYGLNHLVKSRKILDLDRLCFEYPFNQNPYDFDTFFNSQSIGEFVVTNCHTGEAEYLVEKCSKERLLLITKASSSIPLITSMVDIDNNRYLDGGLSDAIPLLRAVERGYHKNVIVMTQNNGEAVSISKYEKAFCERYYRNFPNLVQTLENRLQMYRNTIEVIEEYEKNGDVFIIRPETAMISTFETDNNKLKQTYSHGYQVMKKKYDQLVDFMQD